MCGYDKRTDFVRSKTLYPVPDRDIQNRIELISAVAKKNQQVSEEIEKKLKETDAAKTKLRKADDIEKNRRETNKVEGRQYDIRKNEQEKHMSQENKPKKKSFGKKLLIAIIVLGVVGNILRLFLGTEGSGMQNEVGNTGSSVAWDAIKAASIDALHNGSVNYETISMEELREYLSANGFYVSDLQALPEDMAEGTMSSRRVFTQLNGGDYTQYEIWWDDWYAANASEWHERELYFSDTRRRDDFIEDETLHDIHNEISPLPYGIEFGDTFENVYDKLGLTDEMIAYGTNIENREIYLSITMPETRDGDYVAGDIFINFGDYEFIYSFTEQNELDNYYVFIIH